MKTGQSNSLKRSVQKIKIDKKFTHLLYVREYNIFTNTYKVNVYAVKTDDIFHTIGEYVFRSVVKVDRITFVDYTEEKVNYLVKGGHKIHTFYDKYKKERKENGRG